MTHPRRLLVATLVLISAAGPAHAGGMEPIWLGTPFLEGWVPEDARAIRGVLVMNGWPNDGRWQEAAEFWDFAILRINTDKYATDEIQTDPKLAPLRKPFAPLAHALAYGLKELGRRTGHPEINHAPLVTSGFSRYSPSAPKYLQWFPDRALCFMNGNSGGPAIKKGDKDAELVWHETPSMGLQSEWENIFSGGDKTKLLDSWWRRPDGNLAMAAIHWRVYHAPKTFADLGIIFVDQVIQARIPADWDPTKGPAKLKPVKESDGWLGSHKGWRVPVEKIFETDNSNAHIAPYARFEHDKQRASWLISEEMAWSWRAYSSRYPRARITEPGTSNLVLHQDPQPAPLGHLETGVRAGQPFTASAICHVPNMAKLEFFAHNVKLGQTTKFTGGEAVLGNTMRATGSIQATIVKPGIYGLLVRYTTADGQTGWARPLPLIVWPADPKDTKDK